MPLGVKRPSMTTRVPPKGEVSYFGTAARN